MRANDKLIPQRSNIMNDTNRITDACEILKKLHDMHKSDTAITAAIKYAAWGLVYIEMNRYEEAFNGFVDNPSGELTEAQIKHLRSLGLDVASGDSGADA